MERTRKRETERDSKTKLYVCDGTKREKNKIDHTNIESDYRSGQQRDRAKNVASEIY